MYHTYTHTYICIPHILDTKNSDLIESCMKALNSTAQEAKLGTTTSRWKFVCF